MIQKIKNLILGLSLMLGLLGPTLALSGVSYADTTTNINGNLCQGSDFNLAANGSNGCSNTSGGDTSISHLIKTIVNIVSIIVGAVAVLMIIVGGFRYVTSGGSAEGTKAARQTIIYAIVGLVVVALAQIIVHFVLNNVSNGTA
jgi:cytochrome bd-type quinol oxidase subunit 2